jgi:hypothetical protein
MLYERKINEKRVANQTFKKERQAFQSIELYVEKDKRD